MIEEALEVMGHQAGEPVNPHQDGGKGNDAGVLGVGDPAREERGQLQVGMGGDHHSPDHPHQDCQLLKQAPKITPDGNQTEQDQNPQV